MDVPKFVLIPYSLYLQYKSNDTKTDIKSEILFNPNIKEKSKLLVPFAKERKVPVPEQHKVDANAILKNLPALDPKPFSKVQIILQKIIDHPRLNISEYNTVLIDGGDTGVKIDSFLYHMQSRNKTLAPNYFPILNLLQLSEHLVVNKYAKTSSWLTV